MSLRVWVRGLLIRWVWVRGLLSASGWGGGLLSLRVWVRSFLTQPRAGSGYGASSASGSRLINWIVFSFLGSCQFQMRPQVEMDTDYFPPSEKCDPSSRIPTTPLESLRPAEYGKRLVGINLLYLVHTIPCAHNFLYQQCTLNVAFIWCHISCIICCMQAFMYTISKSPILYTCEFSSSHTSTNPLERRRPRFPSK